MQTKLLAATTACPPTPTAQAAALTEATLVKKPSLITQERFKALWNKRTNGILDALAAIEKAPRPRPANRTPLTIAALEKRLPMVTTRYKRVVISTTTLDDGRVLNHAPVNTLRPNDQGGVISRHPALTPWATFAPEGRYYEADRYIDAAGLAALSRKMGAQVVFASAAMTALSALDAAARTARRTARRKEAERLDAERAALARTRCAALAQALEDAAQRRAERALARNTLKAERTALALALAGETGVTTAAARRALVDAGWDIQGARNALELSALKAKEAKEAKAKRTAASNALAGAPAKIKTALKAVASQALKARIALALDGLKGRFLTVGLKAALAPAALATTPAAIAALTDERLERIIDSAVDEERIRRDLAVERKLKMKAAIKARREEIANLFSRAKGGEKGVPQALTLAITLARKVRG